MSYLPFAILSQLLNSIALTVDKFLLTKIIPDPLIYIFYFSLISLAALLAIPFTSLPSFEVFILASISTLFWTGGAYLMFKALKSGQVQRVIPVIGATTPIVLLAITAWTHPLSADQIKAIIILIFGLVILTLEDLKGRFNKNELMLEILSALFFAGSYYLLRLSFEQQDLPAGGQGFLTVLVWSRPILIPLAVVLLLIPALRTKLTLFLRPKKSLTNKGFLLFVFGQISAGVSELLLVFSISLANPAIVNSLQGIKYIFLMIFSLILGTKFPEVFKNRLSAYFIVTQIIGIGFIGIGLYLLASVGTG